jgi:5-methyltetrahydropteroyltriglutamate--homocysteine methyltransferase
MCGALAARASPEAELDFAVELINRVIEGVPSPDRGGPIRAIHVCRGNWSRKEDVLLEGGYDALIPHLARMRVDQFALEYATPRAGSIEALKGLPERATLGFGCVNPRTSEIETPDAIAARVREAADVLGPERVFLNPDCGFATFCDRPMNETETAKRKLESLVAAAAILRRG